ncbi:MAG TPA: UbiA family prenyltransferase [Candidatus Methylacidiphilales bacterium]|jgi:4-hydroxybenzoate polyprenyltransferase/phosphoserine phosphatase|nr:UbiA family prenyltransferase [Candidatus Methylacidiphilales bacterium]
MDEGVGIIYVDLDHTLVRIDLLRERLLVAIFRNPLIFFKAAAWLFQGGRVRLKTEMARRYALDVANLPFNEELLGLLKKKRDAGAALVLATSAPYGWARAVADHLGIFERVLATDEANGNLKGRRKLAMIEKDAGGKPFAYAGDALVDRPIFEASELPIVVGAGAGLAGRRAEKAVVIRSESHGAPGWWRSLRPHQWSKNILIFAPAIAAHRIDKLWPNGFLAFWAFCLVASAFYLLNDFYDIDVDRRHPDKRLRSQANGALCPSHALALAVLLLLAAAGAAVHLPGKYNLILLCYGIANVLYSAAIKNVVVMDLITLAFLYSLRIFAGGAACGVYVSTWLFAFIFFLALSLAHLKRYTELTQRLKEGIGSAARPTYKVEDMPLLMKVGLGSGLISVLVLALYVTAPQTVSIYRSPALLFVVCVFLFYWIERMWFWASRERIDGDPIVFIVTDHISYLVALASLAVIWIAAVY